MRPHRLVLTAFGPFAGTVEVDLDRLSAGGLFLLHGETGAGKTSLLDGLGFALYGRVPGARGRTGRLRSDHAAPDVRTAVVLEVTLGERRWRITRSPAQERPKARGTGTTTEQARVLLEVRRDGAWETVSTRLDEAAAELDPLLGMSADQFFQVVLLPQGEFARFLRADSKERAQVLQRLFATERFEAVEVWLADRRVRSAAAAQAARDQLTLLGARLAQAVGAEPPETVEPGWWAGTAERCRVLREQAEQEAAAAAAERDAARHQRDVAARTAERQARRRAALAEQERLATAAPGHGRSGAELQAALRAAEIVPVLLEAERRVRAAALAEQEQARVRERLRAVGLAPDLEVERLAAAAEAARARLVRLDGASGLAAELAGEQQELLAAEAETADCRARAELARAVLAALPDRRATVEAALVASRAAGAELGAAEQRRERLDRALTEGQGLAAALERVRELGEEHLLARETAVSLREKESEIRDERFTSMLAELASGLEPGAPCAVCGSADHPDPYEGSGSGVGREDEDRARAAAEDATRLVAELGSRLAAAQAVAAGHRQRLADTGEAPDLAELRQRRAGAVAELARLRGLSDGQSQAAAVVQALDAEQVRADLAVAAAETAGAAARRRAQDAAERAARLSARLAGELQGAPDLDQAVTVARQQAEAADLVVRATEEATRAAAERDRAAGAAREAAAQGGFDGPDGARRAVREPAWRAQAERRRRDHDDRLAAVASALADPDLAVELEPAADVPAASAALIDADLVLDGAVRELAAAVHRDAEVAGLVPRLERCWADLAPLEQVAGRVRRLADLCAGGGGNALRMSLTSFVLAARLEEVAEAASARLLRMTQGRYGLVHTDGAARGGARSGLGLLVRDAWTGHDRETSTLSGGESFQASLALALGLADVVQAEAGGARIEALFVDEGFGSLDEDTLEEVMDVLDGLREGGRVVGLVSHVGELKARIPAQVQVHRSPRGSTLTLSGC